MSTRYIGGLVYNPPGGWSGSFSGSGQYLTLSAGSSFALGTGDFTVECFAYINSFPSNPNSVYFIDSRNAGQTNSWILLTSADGTNSSRLDWYTGSAMINGPTLPSGTWLHLVYTRASSTYGMFVNGIRVATGTDSTNYSTAPTTSYIASRFSADNQLNGYLSNLRVVKGSSVYSPSATSFTVPTGALLPITNTVLLTCRYPTFVDGSTNAFTLTNVGTATTNTANPFPTTVLPNPALGGAGNGIYTLSQYASLRGAGTWPAIDPYYKSVVLNLHGNGINAAQNNTFLDSSGNNYPITRGGNATQGTFSPYGPSWSNYFNGTDAYWKQASSTNYTFGTNDFTIECWINLNSTSTNMRRIFGIGYGANGGSHGGTWDFRYQGTEASGQISLGRYDGSTDTLFTTSGATITVNTWTHVAVSRTGGNLRIFVDGVAYYNAANTTNFSVVTYGGNTELWCGLGYYGPAGGLGGPRYFGGYMSNIRIINGTGIYSSNFTPPSAPLTAITNTQLLTAQSNRFVDNSTNAQAITSFGSVNVQRLNPFTSINYYQPSVIGGSGYFDGTSANIITTNTITTIGTQDFCFEAWVYASSTTSYACIIGNDTAGPGVATFIEMGTARGIFLGGPEVTLTGVKYNQWFHVAYSRVSGTYAGWVNGARLATGSLSNNYTTPIKIGINNYVVGSTSGFGITGYIADGRVTIGSSPYSPSSTTITVPTAPLTAVAGTVYLASMTNAAVFDNAMMNDLQTVGNAQLSTSVKKYGSASMYFDGSGDYLYSIANQTNNFGTGNFTIECWVYFASVGNAQLVSAGPGSNTNAYYWQYYSSQLQFGIQNVGGITATSWTPIANTWYHLAVVRSGTSVYQFVNGTQLGSTATSSQNFVDGPTYVGYGGAGYLNGYIDDLRITKVARYTANFQPPTSQLQDQ